MTTHKCFKELSWYVSKRVLDTANGVLRKFKGISNLIDFYPKVVQGCLEKVSKMYSKIEST